MPPQVITYDFLTGFFMLVLPSLAFVTILWLIRKLADWLTGDDDSDRRRIEAGQDSIDAGFPRVGK